jgi:hypothetical protein
LLTVGLVILPSNLAFADSFIPTSTPENIEENQIPSLSKGGLGGDQQELPGLEFLAPIQGQVFGQENKTVNIALQYPENATIELKINDRLVDKSYLKRIEQSEDNNLFINNWEGVELQPGENVITATGTTKEGEVLAPVSVTVVQQIDPPFVPPYQGGVGGDIPDQGGQNQLVAPNVVDKPLQILSPTPQKVLQTPATGVVVQYPEGAKVELFVNDVLVNDQETLGRVEMDPSNGFYINSWYGLGLKEGENIITAKATLKDGTELPPESVTVILSGQPTNLQIESLQPRIPADGRSTATIQGRLLDKNGQTSNWNTLVTLETSHGEFIGDDLKPGQPGFQVESIGGEFQAVLRAGINAENVRIVAKTSEFEAFTQMQFITQLRQDPILTGVIDLRFGPRGLNYHSRFRDFLPLDRDHSYQFDVSGAVFATGSLGEWQYTAAFNSDRPLVDQDEILEDQYPIYNDNSTTEQVAESYDQVYVRLERSRPNILDPDYFMWGTYNTEEFTGDSLEYGAINRELQGFKANYSFGNLQVTGLFSSTDQAFQRDTIPPDGTRGDYFLSRRNVSQGSEIVYFELEELNRPGTVVERQQLSRGSDYQIDYDRGSIFFREPIFQTAIGEEATILVRRIVVTYNYEGLETQNNKIYGARVRYHLGDQTEEQSWLGGSYFLEDKGDHDFQLWGVDTLIPLGEEGRIVAEYAHSSNSTEMSGKVSGSAYRLEIEGNITDKINARGYYRNTDPGFSNNATTSFVPGQTRYGARLQADLSKTTSLVFDYDHEDNFGTAPRQLTSLEDLLDVGSEPIPGNRVDNSLTTISAGIRQKIGEADVNLDWVYRDRSDRLAPQALESQSHQIRSRVNIPLSDRLTFNALNETNISNDTDILYPNRTAIGVDWEIVEGVSLNLAQQWFTSGLYAGESITNLGINADYKIGTDTTLTGRYNMAMGEDRTIGSGAVGIKQKWQIAPGLQADFGYEHTFSSFTNTSTGTQFIQPFAVGQGASALGLAGGNTYSAGISYTDNPDWEASAKFEHRTFGDNSRTNITADLSGKLTKDLIGLINYSQSSAANQTLKDLGTTRTFNVGLGYSNPDNDKISALLKYEYRKNPSTIPETLLFGTGTGSEDHILSTEAIYTPNWRWEFYGKYAMRSSTTYLANDFISSGIIHLGQLRATYRFAYDWDIQGEARIISQPSAGYTETGLVLDLGYYLTPEIRLGVGYTFGNVDDRDFNGSRNGSGFHFGLTMKLNGLFDGFGEQKPVPPQQQELKTANSNDDQPVGEQNNPQPTETLINESQKLEDQDNQSDNSPAQSNNYSMEKLADFKAEFLVDKMIKNKFSEENIINFYDLTEDDYNLLTEEQYKKMRW